MHRRRDRLLDAQSVESEPVSAVSAVQGVGRSDDLCSRACYLVI